MNKQALKIVKIGGNVINNPVALKAFLSDFSALKGAKILVHGGGKKASELAVKLGVTPKMIEGRRITDADTLEIVTMVYAGLLNKNIVALLQAESCNAIGISGADANIIKASKRKVKEIDYGFAGDIEKVDAKQVEALLQANLTPVCCAITHDANGQLLNTNADTIASEIASAMSEKYKVELNYVFESDGVLLDRYEADSVIQEMDKDYYDQLVKEEVIQDGMIPKLDNCFDALEKGVSNVKIGGVGLVKNDNTICTTLSL